MPITGGWLSKEVVLLCLRGVEISSSIRSGGHPVLLSRMVAPEGQKQECGSLAGFSMPQFPALKNTGLY